METICELGGTGGGGYISGYTGIDSQLQMYTTPRTSILIFYPPPPPPHLPYPKQRVLRKYSHLHKHNNTEQNSLHNICDILITMID